MNIRAFSGHSVSDMNNAIQYALQAFDDWKRDNPMAIIMHVATSISAEPAEENYNYWYVLTVMVNELRPIG